MQVLSTSDFAEDTIVNVNRNVKRFVEFPHCSSFLLGKFEENSVKPSESPWISTLSKGLAPRKSLGKCLSVQNSRPISAKVKRMIYLNIQSAVCTSFRSF
jgi:hypothetical protein